MVTYGHLQYCRNSNIAPKPGNSSSNTTPNSKLYTRNLLNLHQITNSTQLSCYPVTVQIWTGLKHRTSRNFILNDSIFAVVQHTINRKNFRILLWFKITTATKIILCFNQKYDTTLSCTNAYFSCDFLEVGPLGRIRKAES